MNMEATFAVMNTTKAVVKISPDSGKQFRCVRSKCFFSKRNRVNPAVFSYSRREIIPKASEMSQTLLGTRRLLFLLVMIFKTFNP